MEQRDFRKERPIREKHPEVKEGQELSVTIESIGVKGDGIAKVNRFTIFVPKSRVNEYVQIRVTKVFPKFAFAELVE